MSWVCSSLLSFFFKRIPFCFLTGVIGADVKGHGLACEGQPVTSRLAVICGTSSCHMGVSLPSGWGRGHHTLGWTAQPGRRSELLAPGPPQQLPFLSPVPCPAESTALLPIRPFYRDQICKKCKKAWTYLWHHPGQRAKEQGVKSDPEMAMPHSQTICP